MESVDSVGLAQTRIMLIQTNNISQSPKQLPYKPLKHPIVCLWVFSWWTTHPVVLKRIAKVLNQKVPRRPKSSDGLVNLHDSFTMIFARYSSIFHWLMHQPITFIQGLKSHKAI